MFKITHHHIPPTDMQRGDIIMAIDGVEISPHPTVLGVHTVSATLSPVGRTTRTLYFDQHETVSVNRAVLDATGGELKLTNEEVVAVMDALLIAAEEMERRGNPSALVRRAMRKVHFFSSSHVGTEITISPRR
jgi:hypothetical protein